MRNVLIDHARELGRLKRGGNKRRVPLDDEAVLTDEPTIDLLTLGEALERLAVVDGRKAQVVELRYFGGFSIEEIAAHLETSTATIKRDWSVARTWLEIEMRQGESKS
jgi:RNA polymerase sigma factor (TIGR02999 family)